ncbi:MAG: hypothetical protein M3N09_08885 [Actinomycetota bacterium]|nr:hypothetical protein [Actinomycetota bacterium]
MSATQAGLLDEEGNVGFVYALTRDAEDLEPGLGGPHRIAHRKRSHQLREPPDLRLEHGDEGAGDKECAGGRRLAVLGPTRLEAR